MIEQLDVPTGALKQAKSWPVTVVAVFYLLQGLSLSYSAIVYGRVSAQPEFSAFVGSAMLYGVFGVALVVSGVGLLVRIRACLTIAVILAGAYLAGAGESLAGATFEATASPLLFVAALAFVVLAWLQYVILRSKSTVALFSQA